MAEIPTQWFAIWFVTIPSLVTLRLCVIKTSSVYLNLKSVKPKQLIGKKPASEAHPPSEHTSTDVDQETGSKQFEEMRNLVYNMVS